MNGPTKPKLLLRHARPEDLSEILRIFRYAIYKTCSEDYSPKQLDAWAASKKDLDRWAAMIAEQFFLVTESEGEIVGFASLKDQSHVHMMFVDPQFQQKGVAGQLLQNLEDEAAKSGKSYLTVFSSHTAKPFFERMGYKIIRSRQVSIRGIELQNFEMGRWL